MILKKPKQILQEERKNLFDEFTLISKLCEDKLEYKNSLEFMIQLYDNVIENVGDE